jgi:hypothetical protein
MILAKCSSYDGGNGCGPTGRPSAGLPEGWHDVAGSHQRSSGPVDENRTDSGRSAGRPCWVRPPAKPRTVPTARIATAAAVRDATNTDRIWPVFPTRRHERDRHKRNVCGRSAPIGFGSFSRLVPRARPPLTMHPPAAADDRHLRSAYSAHPTPAFSRWLKETT